MWTSQSLRQIFLDFFVKQKHSIVGSSSLLPDNDPTLLFTNAGMVQFKNVFLGVEQRDFTRATSSQRCLRAGGKHNDLDEVGYTARHHTFFEMLGNFSFGDYFKREAIQLAWYFITKELGIPAEKLWVTVFVDDDESAAIWLDEMKIDPTRFSRCGEADNFWRMGDTGPCGPCTEIFYDHGPEVDGGPPGTLEQEGDRYVEIWNLVFMQYDRTASGELKPLPAPSVDTGMGLERLTAVMQGVHNNYDTDLFQPIIKIAAKLANTEDLSNRSLRVIADHIRATAFLILDGVQPGNEGRNYVLRRIIRRAIRHGYLLGIELPFFSQLLPPFIKIMEAAYPELKREQAHLATVIEQEEKQFAKTLNQGMRLLNQVLTELNATEIPGDTVFKLYDTYGFPTDLTADIARERNVTIDWDGFEAAMQAQRNRAKQSSQFGADYHSRLTLKESSCFEGHANLELHAKNIGLYNAEGSVESLQSGEHGIIVLDQTPFYPEAGGQVGDAGIIQSDSAEFIVEDTQKKQNAIIHSGYVKSGTIELSDDVHAKVDRQRRAATVLNHSATHLLHAVLRDLLGDQVVQKGSLVAPERLRFDFSYGKPLSFIQLQSIEANVNQYIRANYVIDTQVMPYDKAIEQGAMALFGEKYTTDVRVLKMGKVSMELCGGTHAKATGDIGLFKIMSETGIAAGIRRIEAVTGHAAIEAMQNNDTILFEASQLLKTPTVKLLDKVEQLQSQLSDTRKTLEQLQQKMAQGQLLSIQQQASQIGDITLLAAEFPGVDAKSLRHAVEQSISKFPNAIVVLATVQAEKVSIIAGVDKSLIPKIKAGDLVNYVASQVGGKGGGKPELAQAGGTEPQHLAKALASAAEWVAERSQ